MSSLTRTISRGLLLDRAHTNKQQRKYILYALKKQKAEKTNNTKNEKE